MSRYTAQDQSFEEYGRAEGEQFYNSVQRLIKHFQTLDTKDSPSEVVSGGTRLQRGRDATRSGVYYAYAVDPEVTSRGRQSGIVGGPNNHHQHHHHQKLERSRSLGRLGEHGQHRMMAGSDRDSHGQKRIGAYIALRDDDYDIDDYVDEEEVLQKPAAFVRGSGTRRTFSGVTRRNPPDMVDNTFDDNRSDNFRLVSHSQYISSPLPDDPKVDLLTSQEPSRHFVRNSPKMASSRSIGKRSNSVPREKLNGSHESQDFKRNELRSSMRHKSLQPQVEYVQTSGENCFPFKKKKSQKSKVRKGHYNPERRGAYSDYEDHYVSEDSVVDTGYDSSASAGYARHNQRPYSRLPKHVDIRDHEYGNSNYQVVAVEDAANNSYSVSSQQEPQIHVTKEGYKMLDLDVNVSGFRPEDIQIVTQGKFLQVIAKGVVLKRDIGGGGVSSRGGAGGGDSRIYRELKRQFTLPEVANAEYLQGILSPEGVLHITGPVGVSTNTKKLKRKRVKFQIE